jgi:hypothetical protein
MSRLAADKYTPERVKRVLDGIRMGATRGIACKYAGISHDTLNRWEKRYPEFRGAVDLAEGEAAVGWLAKIEEAADKGDWQAAWKKLASRYPEDYGRTVSEQRHSGPDGKEPVKFTIVIDRNPHDAETEGG